MFLYRLLISESNIHKHYHNIHNRKPRTALVWIVILVYEIHLCLWSDWMPSPMHHSFTQEKKTALHYATAGHKVHVPIVVILIEAGADIDVTDEVSKII